MSLLSVFIILLIVSTDVIDGRALRRRRQTFQSNAYSGTNDFRNYQNTGYGQNSIRSERSWYPIGNRWFMQVNPPYPNNNPFLYNTPPIPYLTNYGYAPLFPTYGTRLDRNSMFPNNNEYLVMAYGAQSFIPPSSDYYFVPLPGANRRRP